MPRTLEYIISSVIGVSTLLGCSQQIQVTEEIYLEDSKNKNFGWVKDNKIHINLAVCRENAEETHKILSFFKDTAYLKDIETFTEFYNRNSQNKELFPYSPEGKYEYQLDALVKTYYLYLSSLQDTFSDYFNTLNRKEFIEALTDLNVMITLKHEQGHLHTKKDPIEEELYCYMLSFIAPEIASKANYTNLLRLMVQRASGADSNHIWAAARFFRKLQLDNGIEVWFNLEELRLPPPKSINNRKLEKIAEEIISQQHQ